MDFRAPRLHPVPPQVTQLRALRHPADAHRCDTKYVNRQTFFCHSGGPTRLTRSILDRDSGVEIATCAVEMPAIDTYSVIVMVLMIGVCLLHGPRVKKWRAEIDVTSD